jgi:hypothetical protein
MPTFPKLDALRGLFVAGPDGRISDEQAGKIIARVIARDEPSDADVIAERWFEFSARARQVLAQVFAPHASRRSLLFARHYFNAPATSDRGSVFVTIVSDPPKEASEALFGLDGAHSILETVSRSREGVAVLREHFGQVEEEFHRFTPEAQRVLAWLFSDDYLARLQRSDVMSLRASFDIAYRYAERASRTFLAVEKAEKSVDRTIGSLDQDPSDVGIEDAVEGAPKDVQFVDTDATVARLAKIHRIGPENVSMEQSLMIATIGIGVLGDVGGMDIFRSIAKLFAASSPELTVVDFQEYRIEAGKGADDEDLHIEIAANYIGCIYAQQAGDSRSVADRLLRISDLLGMVGRIERIDFLRRDFYRDAARVYMSLAEEGRLLSVENKTRVRENLVWIKGRLKELDVPSGERGDLSIANVHERAIVPAGSFLTVQTICAWVGGYAVPASTFAAEVLCDGGLVAMGLLPPVAQVGALALGMPVNSLPVLPLF